MPVGGCVLSYTFCMGFYSEIIHTKISSALHQMDNQMFEMFSRPNGQMHINKTRVDCPFNQAERPNQTLGCQLMSNLSTQVWSHSCQKLKFTVLLSCICSCQKLNFITLQPNHIPTLNKLNTLKVNNSTKCICSQFHVTKLTDDSQKLKINESTMCTSQKTR